MTAFSAQQQRDFFASLPSDLAAVLSSPSASARKGEGEVKALSEQKQKDVFAVVEVCVRMLLMRLAEREKEISGEGDAGDSNTAKAGSGGGEEGEGEHEGGGGAVKEDEQRPVSSGITLKVKGEVKDDGDTKDQEVPQGKESQRSALSLYDYIHND